MASFYDLSKQERLVVVSTISNNALAAVLALQPGKMIAYFGDEDTYIRKSAYIAVGKIYFAHLPLQSKIINLLDVLFTEKDFRIRQTVINTAGEIGKKDFKNAQHFFDQGLLDQHYSPRNAVIGSIKKMGEVNPKPVLQWAKKYLHHPDKEIRREICHGIELRGRKYPQDILPLLQELQYDTTARVRNTLVHVIGQVAYKKGCLETVIQHLQTWENKALVADAIEEIIDVHHRYGDFSFFTQAQAKKYIRENYKY